MRVSQTDFVKGKENVLYKKQGRACLGGGEGGAGSPEFSEF